MMLPVPEPTQNRNVVRGAMTVICLGRFSITRAATATIQSIPPAACINAAVVTTARMMAMAAAGGSPGASPKMKTRMKVPYPPPNPPPTPPGPGAHDDAAQDDERLEDEAHAHGESFLVVEVIRSPGRAL